MAKRNQWVKSESLYRRRTDNTMAKRYQSGKSESLYRRRTDNTMAKRYQRDNQNPYIEEELTTQWSKYTKGVIRILISKKSRRHNGQKIPKG
jgi:hypothetical protein